MIRNPQEIVRWFEEEVAAYTGSKYAVSCDNCTNAIKMCCDYFKVDEVTIPRHTYLSVPQSIHQSGGKLRFSNEEWVGIYQLKPYPIYDAAKRLTRDMYIPNTLMCLSFGIKKPLKIGKGGMILTDSLHAYEELKKLRWSGRTESSNINYDMIDSMGYNSYITPEWAARGLMLLGVHPDVFPDQLEIPNYRDLKTFPVFKDVPSE